MGPAALRHGERSRTGDGTHVPRTGRRTHTHHATRDARCLRVWVSFRFRSAESPDCSSLRSTGGSRQLPVLSVLSAAGMLTQASPSPVISPVSFTSPSLPVSAGQPAACLSDPRGLPCRDEGGLTPGLSPNPNVRASAE